MNTPISGHNSDTAELGVAAPADSPPDWASIAHVVECPLCEYNLRGLSQPRCPECGFTFEWREILDVTRRKHRYLFEHHPERNFWSFFKTLAGGLIPWRFWRTLHPAQRADVARLTLYRWVVKGIAGLPMAVTGLWLLMLSASWPVNDWPRLRLRDLIDVFDPRKATLASELVNPLLRVRLYIFVLIVTLFLFALPEMSTCALLIFRSSMRQAKIDRHHVDRCVAYSFDVVVWPISFMLMLGTLAVAWPFRVTSWQVALLCWCLLLLLPAVWVLMSTRLAFAYRYYLRMRHAVAAVMAGQVIVALAVMVVMMLLKELVVAI